MRSVIVTAVVEIGSCRLGSGAPPASKHWEGSGWCQRSRAFQHVVSGGENISHIVKESEAEAFPEIGQADRGKAQFLTVDEQRRAADGETGIGIARSCLI